MMDSDQGISLSVVEQWKKEFTKDRAKLIAQKACTQFNTLTLISSNDPPLSHIFNTKISTEVRPVVDQNNAGTCWIYACLNVLRTFYCKENNVDEFQFSTAHLYFWDKVERCNYMLESYIKLAKEGEEPDDRTLSYLLSAPAQDGGSWQMLVNLIEKYGLVPHTNFSDPYLAKYSHGLKTILNNQLRAHCKTLMIMVKDGKNEEEVKETKEKMMAKLFEVIGTCLGFPPEKVEFDYYDKDKKYHKIGPITPLEFYRTKVKPFFDVDQQVVLVNDPRPHNGFGRTYSIDYLNNMVNATPVKYLNLPIDKIETFTKDSIKADKPVWFGCNTSEMCLINGLLCTEQFDFELMFGISMRSIDKASRMSFGEATSSHAMVLNGLNEQEDGHVDKWRVENSWGDSSGAGKGYLVMSDSWFNEYLFMAVIDQSLVDAETLELWKQEPTILPAWDPIGVLARG